MIKTPIIYSAKSWSICDSNGDIIAYDVNANTGGEAVNRINMHDELVKSLRDMVEIVGSNFCSNMETKCKYKQARELLEKNK